MKPLIPYFMLPEVDAHFGLTMKAHGMAAFAGILVWLFASCWQCRRTLLPLNVILHISPSIIVTGICGGHIFYIFFTANTFNSISVRKLFDIWSGQNLLGVIVIGGLVGFYTTKNVLRNLNLSTEISVSNLSLAYLNAMAFGLPIGLAIARIGCVMIHERVGVPTTFWLGINGICKNGQLAIACHDIALYESICLALFFLFLIAKANRTQVARRVLPMLAIFYGSLRIIFIFFENPPLQFCWRYLVYHIIIGPGLICLGLLLNETADSEKSAQFN